MPQSRQLHADIVQNVYWPKLSSPGTLAPLATRETLSCHYINQLLQHTGGKIHGPGGAPEIMGTNPGPEGIGSVRI
jgi:hypothetical protein